jgi:hypothetical protein
MAKKKGHSRVKIATKLAPANDLATQGKLQSEIADRTRGEGDKIAELELENSRLRQQVTDLLLEKPNSKKLTARDSPALFIEIWKEGVSCPAIIFAQQINVMALGSVPRRLGNW